MATTKSEVRRVARQLREAARALDWAVRAGREDWAEDVVDICAHWAVPEAGTLADDLATEHDISY